jgi:hypothetical protein
MPRRKPHTPKPRRRPLPDVPTDITRAELDALRAPKIKAGTGTAGGYRFVYSRSPAARPDSAGSGCCRFRVRLKRGMDATGKGIYDDFSGKWDHPRDAARFVAGLLRVRYGPDWPAVVLGPDKARPRPWRVVRCKNDASRWWLLVQLDGRWYRVKNPAYGDGGFHSAMHAAWYVKAWCAAKFGQIGPAALGFYPVPPGTRTEAGAAGRVAVLGRFRYRQLNLFAEDVTEPDVAAVPWIDTLDEAFRAEHAEDRLHL